MPFNFYVSIVITWILMRKSNKCQLTVFDLMVHLHILKMPLQIDFV